ncbi:hypothetical protein NA56DRAFT_186674 [Hyaloscypha hepaticicola]|uniref:Uncharacterized protein n=1 Tax=Hyaloscypha hepaticicola TaxID=2082293 RepID=A0A2J6Q1M3_9HELO|nr:hypothetical protein NA56DRAFT_186674 [Hyaloscypha hepaticicola]
MGAAINEGEDVTGPARPQEEEKLVGSHEQIYLGEEKSLFIRIRKMAPGPHVHDFVNISIGPRLSWQQQIPDRSSRVPSSDSESRNSRRDGTSNSTDSMNGHSNRLVGGRVVEGGRILQSCPTQQIGRPYKCPISLPRVRTLRPLTSQEREGCKRQEIRIRRREKTASLRTGGAAVS